MSTIFSQISPSQWLVLFCAALLIGISKGGLKGLMTITVLIMAQAFDTKASTGIVLPLLIMGDFMAIYYYRRDAAWAYVWQLLPAALVGVLVGVWVGNQLDDHTFRRVLAWIVLLGVLLILWQEKYPIPDKTIKHPVTGSMAGFLGGFTTMVGNAAGPVMSVYLLATRLPKNQFIGTAAWFFLFINLFKMPFHIWVWGTISWSSFQLNLLVFPIIVLGFIIGVNVVKLIPEKMFRYLVIAVTILAAFRMIF